MILMAFKITVKPAIGIKRMNAITKKAYATAATYWYENMLDDAFAAGAASRHHHKPRSRKWKEKKIALAKAGVGEEGGTRDIVFTGETRRNVQSFASVRAFPRRARVKMAGPRYITMHAKDPNQPDLGAEITHVTESQRRRLMKIFKDAVVLGINTCQDKRTYKA